MPFPIERSTAVALARWTRAHGLAATAAAGPTTSPWMAPRCPPRTSKKHYIYKNMPVSPLVASMATDRPRSRGRVRLGFPARAERVGSRADTCTGRAFRTASAGPRRQEPSEALSWSLLLSLGVAEPRHVVGRVALDQRNVLGQQCLAPDAAVVQQRSVDLLAPSFGEGVAAILGGAWRWLRPSTGVRVGVGCS